MTILYVYEPGIKLWEQPNTIGPFDFVTFSFLGVNTEDIWPVIQELAGRLAPEFPTTIKWRTVGYSLEEFKVQEIRLRKEIENTLGPTDILKKNTASKIYSYIQLTNTKKISFNPAELTQHRNTFLIFSANQNNNESIWEQLSKADKGVSPQNILEFLTNNRNSIISRFIENDTHSAGQLIAPAQKAVFISTSIKSLAITKITTNEIPDRIQTL